MAFPLRRCGETIVRGDVYKALDLRLQRHVALKTLPRDVSADAERRQRFLQEARAASALNDPHIITVHDISEADGTDFLVRELVEGRTLHEMARTALPVELAAIRADVRDHRLASRFERVTSPK